MGKASRDKGKRGERDLANTLSQLGVRSRRGVQYRGGPGSPDVVTALSGIHVECKRTEQLSLYPALWQAYEEMPADHMPVVMHRRNGKPWVVVLNLDDFVKICREAGRVEEREDA
jgi:hypothetical protein